MAGELIFPAPVGMVWLTERSPIGTKPLRRAGIIPTCPRSSRLIRLNSDLASYVLVQGKARPELMPQDAFNDILYALSHRSRTLNYLEPQGSMELREALSVHLQTTGIQASPDSILIVSGSLQALHLISVGLLPRGSAVLLEKPSYLIDSRLSVSRVENEWYPDG